MTVRYAEQVFTSSEVHLNYHSKAHRHEWIKNPMETEEVYPLLAIIITMGIMWFPTVG